MSEQTDEKLKGVPDEGGDAALEERSRRMFRDSVDALDAATLSRLNRARQAALTANDGARADTGRRPAAVIAATAAVAVLTVALWPDRLPQEPAAERETVVAAASEQPEDLEIVLEDENLDMLAELEFYDWVDSEAAFLNEPPGNENIGNENIGNGNIG